MSHCSTLMLPVWLFIYFLAFTFDILNLIYFSALFTAVSADSGS